MNVRALFLSVALFLAGLLAASPAADESFRYRYWMVPADKISRSPWGDEKYFPVRMERLERWLDSLRRAPDELSGAIAEIALDASLVDGALSEGEGEIRFRNASPPTCELTPCSVALSQLRWDGGAAQVGSDGKGPVTLEGIAPEKKLLFAWSLAPESEEGGKRVFHFELPPAPTVRLRLKLPANLTPSVDAGLVSWAENEGVWLIEPGSGGDFRLTLSERDTSPASAVLPTVSEQILCRVALEGIELVYTARIVAADELSDPIALTLDEPFLPEKVEWESTGAADAVWEKNGRDQKIVILPPSPSARQTEVLTLTALAPFDPESPLRLPAVRSEGVLWQETGMIVSFDAPAAPQNYIFTDAGRSGPGGLMRLFKRDGSVEIPFVLTEERNSFESATQLSVVVGNYQFETDLFVKMNAPAARRLTIPIKPEWEVESVSVDGIPISFRFDAAGLTLTFEKPIPSDPPLKVHISGRRKPAEPCRLSDCEPLMIDEPAVGAHLLALSYDTPAKVTLVDDKGCALPHPDVPQEQVLRLFGAPPDGIVFSLADTKTDAIVRFEAVPPLENAELSGRAAIGADSIREEWSIRCTPSSGSRLDMILIALDIDDASSWNVASTPSGSGGDSLKLSPPSEDERSRYENAKGRSLWEIRLPEPQSAPFSIRLSRDRKTPLADGADIPLPALFGASNQTGRIDVSTLDFTPVRLEAPDLEPIAPPPAEKGAVPTALASFRWTPSEKEKYTLTAWEGKKIGQKGWCRFFRLESYYAATGAVRTQAVCRIENRGTPSLQIRFPESIDLVDIGNVRGGKELIPYTYHPEKQELVIPLPSQRRDFVLSFDYETRISPFRFWGTISRQVPRLNLPVLAGDWTAHIPTAYCLDTRRAVSPTRIPLDAPVREYRLINRYHLLIVLLLAVLAGLAVGFRFRPLHLVLLGFSLLFLFFAIPWEVAAWGCLGWGGASLLMAFFNYLFFHRRNTDERNGTDPACDVSEIGFVTRNGAALLLILLGASSLAAEESFSIFVPARDGERAVDEPVWISEELLNRLTNWERENAGFESGVRFQSALYEGRLDYNRETGEYSLFHLTAKYQIQTAGDDGRVDLPAMPIYQEGGVLIDGVAGSATVSSDGGRTRLELRGVPAGRHELKFSLLTEPFGENTPDGFFLPLPAVPDSKLLLRLPADAAPPRLLGAMGQVSTSLGILTADLGQTSGMTFLPPEKASNRGEASIKAVQEFRLVLSEDQIVLRGEFRLQTAGRVDEVAFLADPRYRLLRCTSPDADLVPAPISEKDGRISIRLRQPVSGTLTLRADFAPRDFSGVGNLPLPMIRIAGAAVVSSRLFTPEGFDPPEYDLTDSSAPEKSVSFRPAEANPTISESASYRFGLCSTTAAYHAELRTGGRLWQLTLRVPQNSVVESLEIADGRRGPIRFRKSEEKIGEGVFIHVFFDEALDGVYQIDLRLRTAASERFPLTGIFGIAADDAELSFEFDPSLCYGFFPPGDWTGLPAADGQRRWALPDAAAAISPPAISVAPNYPVVRSEADIFFYPLAESLNRTWELRAECTINVESGQVNRLEFNIDDSFRSDSIRIEPDSFKFGIERSADGGRRLLLTPNAPIRERTWFILYASVPGAPVRLPWFDFAGTSEKKVQIRLPRAEDGVPLDWQAQNLETCKPEMLGDEPQQGSSYFTFGSSGRFPREVTEKSRIAYDAFQTYRPSSSKPYRAAVSDENAGIRLNRAETEYHVRCDGTYWGRAAYDLRLGPERECKIQVPSGLSLLNAEAADVPLTLISKSNEGIFLLRFVSDVSFVHLEILFTSTLKRTDSLRVRQRLYRDFLLAAPFPVGVDAAPTFWTIRFEDNARNLPYYVSQGGERPDLKTVRKSFPGAGSTAPLSETGNWKRPVAAGEASALRARLDVEKLSYLLDLVESIDPKEPISPAVAAGWLGAWQPLYDGVKAFFDAQGRPEINRAQTDAFCDGRREGSPPLTKSSGKKDFDGLSSRWEDLSQRFGPASTPGEKGGADAAPSADEGAALSADDPSPAESTDLVLFGAADKVREIVLLVPASRSLSHAPYRTFFSIAALLAAAAVLFAGWRTRTPEIISEAEGETDEADVSEDEKTVLRADPEPGAAESDHSPSEEGVSASSGESAPTVLLEDAPERPVPREDAAVEITEEFAGEESEIILSVDEDSDLSDETKKEVRRDGEN
ncbi:MAG: hypothetical protein K6E55_02325 [Thermoguttaceae bacterium]|nr:hypothetical protein [Thermoguttaceae bacterium]